MSKELIERLRAFAPYASPNAADLMHEAADALEAKTAPVGEREAAIEAAYAAVVNGGWDSVKDMGIQMFQAGAAHQRQQARVEAMPDVVEFAVSRWEAEVKHRPLVNVHRRALDGTWRQIIRFAGGDPDELCGPDHDAMLASLNKGGSHE